MSEPSLRTTEPWLTDELVELAAQAIYEYRNYGHFTDPRPNPDAAEHWRHEARCWLAKVGPALALRVIHTQRDAIAQAVTKALAPGITCDHDEWTSACRKCAERSSLVADAVLATLTRGEADA